MTLSQKTRNLLSAGILLVVGIFWFIEAGDYGPLSRLYPRVLAVLVVLLALLLGGLTLAGFGPVIKIAMEDARERHLRSGSLMVALVVWTALIPLVGLLIASILGVLFMGYLTFRSHHGTMRAVIIALVVVVGFYFLFQRVLNVYFTMGILG